MANFLAHAPEWALQAGGVLMVLALFSIPVRLGWISLHHKD